MPNDQLPSQQRIHCLNFNIIPREIFQAAGGGIISSHRILQSIRLGSRNFCSRRVSRCAFLFCCAHKPLYAPPSTNIVWPVMYDARSDASQTIASATSFGSAILFNAESPAQAAKISSSLLFCDADLARANSFNRSVAV